MHRSYAVSCLPLALAAFTAPCLYGENLSIEVVQTRTGIRIEEIPHGVTLPALPYTSRCTASSGTYTRKYGFACRDTAASVEPDVAPARAGYEFFYDVNVIMSDHAHLVLHCSSILDDDCKGFPGYPESTSITCDNFVSAGALYKDCTAVGPAPDGIGLYEAAQHGDRVTIFGSTWKRDYLKYGSWLASVIVPVQASAVQPQNPPAAVPKDEEQPIDPEIIIQAKAGSDVAQYKLGYHYYLGRGISQDYGQAAIWWQRAAEQGYADAQNNLGVLYNSGKGVPQSYSEAYFWENLAAARANGSMQAQFARNRDDSAAKLSIFERLRVQHRASQWFSKHPIKPQQSDSTSPGPVQESKPEAPVKTGENSPEPPKTAQPDPDHAKPDQTAPDSTKPSEPQPQPR